MKKVSVVLPTYNEKKNINILIPLIQKTLKKYTFEIIIVDDNSPDGTAEAGEKLNKKYKNIRVIKRMNKRGIGSALTDGYNAAKNEIIVSTDTDLSFSPKDILRLLKKINEGYDLVVGSRHQKDGKYEKKSVKTFLKSCLSKGGNMLIRSCAGVPVHDFSANFRAIRKKVWKSIKVKDNTNSMLFEMILKTYYNNYKVTEISVVFKDRIHGESKLSLLKETPKFLFKFIMHTTKVRILRLK